MHFARYNTGIFEHEVCALFLEMTGNIAAQYLEAVRERAKKSAKSNNKSEIECFQEGIKTVASWNDEVRSRYYIKAVAKYKTIEGVYRYTVYQFVNQVYSDELQRSRIRIHKPLLVRFLARHLALVCADKDVLSMKYFDFDPVAVQLFNEKKARETLYNTVVQQECVEILPPEGAVQEVRTIQPPPAVTMIPQWEPKPLTVEKQENAPTDKTVTLRDKESEAAVTPAAKEPEPPAIPVVEDPKTPIEIGPPVTPVVKELEEKKEEPKTPTEPPEDKENPGTPTEPPEDKENPGTPKSERTEATPEPSTSAPTMSAKSIPIPPPPTPDHPAAAPFVPIGVRSKIKTPVEFSQKDVERKWSSNKKGLEDKQRVKELDLPGSEATFGSDIQKLFDANNDLSSVAPGDSISGMLK